MNWLLLLLVAATAMTGEQLEPDTRRPNVLLIVVDDLGIRDLSSYGSTSFETPNIDALAASGVRFTDAYSASPVCSPTRVALQTGKAPARSGITDWIPGASHLREGRPLETPSVPSELPLGEVTIGEAFKANGYRTFYAGKWHLGSEGFFPEDQGYDRNAGGNHAGMPKSYYSPYRNPQLPDGPDGEYLPDRLTSETIDFISEASEQPFFAMLSYYTVHTPLVPAPNSPGNGKPGNAARLERNGASTKLVQDDIVYASMISALDKNIGRLLEAIDENTIVVFVSDNGGLSTDARRPWKLDDPWRAGTSNEPFRAGKGWVYEGGIRIPLLIRAPDTTNPGAVSAAPVISMDLAPTLVELAGIEEHGLDPVDGLSLASHLEHGTDLPDRPIRVYFPHYHASLSEPSWMLREGDYKLVYFYEEDEAQLYNLADDIGETQDLAGDHPERVERMKAGMQAWLESVGAEQPTRNESGPTRRPKSLR